jgi:hypothetical protein
MPVKDMLAEEVHTYERNRKQLLREHREQVVLFKGDDVIGCFDTMEEAFVRGTALFGATPFLVGEVLEQDRVFHVVSSSRQTPGEPDRRERE